MRIHIDYQAAYEYEEPVSLSPHIVRVLPRCTRFIRMIDQEFHCGGGARVQFRRDLYDNETACCFFPSVVRAFGISLSTTLQLTTYNPLDFLLDSRGLSIPPAYSESELAVLEPHLRDLSGVRLPAPLAPEGSRPTVETLMSMICWTNEEIAYERRDEGAPLSPEELLKRRAGSCRDFTVLLVAALRQNGVAGRLVSGFLWEGPSESSRVAENSLHAWVEAYLPGAGWLALDPTNGSFCDHRSIATAAGASAEDIAPVSGTYYGERQVPSRLTPRLTISEIE